MALARACRTVVQAFTAFARRCAAFAPVSTALAVSWGTGGQAVQHGIDVTGLGPGGSRMAGAIQACVHCGFCLPVCPTYQLLGQEMDSPRGRIYLMKGVLEGELAPDAVAAHIDRCLGCLACVSACPSNVRYDELVMLFRQRLESRRRRALAERLLRRGLMAVLPCPGRFRVAARVGQLARAFSPGLPARLRGLVELLPDRLPEARALPAVFPATGRRRARVALLAGCVQQVLAPAINEAALRVLSYHGVEVWIPAGQGCCGALAMHTGLAEFARRLARRNLAAFSPDEVDAIVTTAAGCGSAMKEYPLLFEGRPEQARARALAAKVRDVSEFLEELGPLPPGPLPTATLQTGPLPTDLLQTSPPPTGPLQTDGAEFGRQPQPAVEPADAGLGCRWPAGPDIGLPDQPVGVGRPVRVAYHDACHLAHAQGVRAAPRRLLARIPNVELVEIPDGGLCCGSAGTYNLEQPELARQLQQRKVEAVQATGAPVVATGNIGCMVQIAAGLARVGAPVRVVHTVQLLDLAYQQAGAGEAVATRGQRPEGAGT